MYSLFILAIPFLPDIVSAAPHRRNTSNANSAVAPDRAVAVKEAFQFAWDGYVEYSFPDDELLPVNNSFRNSRNGWGASAVDALSTAILTELPDVVTTIVDYIPEIDFSVSRNNQSVDLFETTIRYLGGMLSGYDLLTDPYKHLVGNSTAKPQAILRQAVNLANNLSFAFGTLTGIPVNTLYLDPPYFDLSQENGLATVGTLVLEWTRLSDITGDPTYANLTQHAQKYLLDPQPASSEPFPGLLGTTISISTGEFLDADGGWGGGDDSFYEYLLKMYVYDPSRFSTYKDRWILAADSSIEYLASHPSSRPDLTFLAGFSGRNLTLSSGHLACFDGGNFILGGLVLGETKYVDFGLELVHSCHETYASTLTGIGPEGFSWDDQNIPANQADFYERAGFYIVNGQYLLRPEVLESFYYAYRATGNTTYQDWSWNGFVAMNATTRTGSGFSDIVNVNAEDGGGFKNFQESFVFAEFFKYAYLIHAKDARVQVQNDSVQDWVLSTEGHPFKVLNTEE